MLKWINRIFGYQFIKLFFEFVINYNLEDKFSNVVVYFICSYFFLIDLIGFVKKYFYFEYF